MSQLAMIRSEMQLSLAIVLLCGLAVGVANAQGDGPPVDIGGAHEPSMILPPGSHETDPSVFASDAGQADLILPGPGAYPGDYVASEPQEMGPDESDAAPDGRSQLPSYEPIPEEGVVIDGEHPGLGHGLGPGLDLGAGHGSHPADKIPAPLYSTGSWFEWGDWYTEQQIVFMQRGPTRKVTLAFDLAVAGLPEFNLRDSRHSYEAGTRLTFGKILGRDGQNRDHKIEFTFLGLLDYSTAATFGAAVPGSVQTALGPGGTAVGGFANADEQAFVLDADFDSFEVNFRIESRLDRDRLVMQPDGVWVRQMTPGRTLAWIAGGRVISTGDDLIYTSVSANPANERGTLEMNAQNDMFGPQIGVELSDQYTNWGWRIGGKMGGLFNFIERRTRIAVIDGGVASSRSQVLEDENLVFLAEGTVGLFYQWCPNIRLTCSYDAIFVNGIAATDENLSINPGGFSALDVTGNTFFHGGTIGFEMYW